MGALTPVTIQETRPDRPGWQDYSQCVHCGLCLNSCPTYRLLGQEADSPRGRIHQMILVEEGRLPVGDSFVRHMDLCLDCRACETACPSGVEYGKLIEAARMRIEQDYRRPWISRTLRSIGLRHIIPYPKRVAAAGGLLRLYQRSGLQKLARASGILNWMGKLGAAEEFLPRMDSDFTTSDLGRVFPAKGEQRARVAFFAGCIQQVAFAELNRATVRVLQENGCEVTLPAGQVCCGALQVHAGLRDAARELAEKNMDAFDGEPFDAVISNTSGCGAALKDYPRLTGEQPRARAFSARVRDVSEFLAKLGLRPPGNPLEMRVTMQDSCHLVHAQGIRNAPRELLRAIPGLELTEMRLADQCCGSAGAFNLTQPEVSRALLDEKTAEAAATGADAIVTSNPGCLLQLRAGVRKHKTGQEVCHVIELLDRAYGPPGQTA